MRNEKLNTMERQTAKLGWQKCVLVGEALG